MTINLYKSLAKSRRMATRHPMPHKHQSSSSTKTYRRHHSSSTKPLQPPEDIKPNLVRHKGHNDRRNRQPGRSPNKDGALAVHVSKTTPEKQETTKGEVVRRDDPLLARVGYVKCATDGWEDNDCTLHPESLPFCHSS